MSEFIHRQAGLVGFFSPEPPKEQEDVDSTNAACPGNPATASASPLRSTNPRQVLGARRSPSRLREKEREEGEGCQAARHPQARPEQPRTPAATRGGRGKGVSGEIKFSGGEDSARRTAQSG